MIECNVLTVAESLLAKLLKGTCQFAKSKQKIRKTSKEELLSLTAVPKYSKRLSEILYISFIYAY